jgi:Arc/MetJ-type ribon-helix-helix transcriptional regulator
MKGRVTYSEAFRRGIVERVERGMYKSLSEANRRNGKSVKKLRTDGGPMNL